MRCGAGLDPPNLDWPDSWLCSPAQRRSRFLGKKKAPRFLEGLCILKTLLNYGAPGLGAAPLTPQFVPGPNGGFHVGAFCGD